LHQAVLDRKDELAPPTRARVPFVLVITKQLVPATASMPLTELNGKPGFVTNGFDDVHRFDPIESVEVPDGDAYIVFDVDRGAEYLDVRPNDALVSITAAGRTPLTVDEGIAFITQFPDSLEKNHCFSLLASRGSDKRVPALWDQQGDAQARLVLGRQPAHLVGRGPCGRPSGSARRLIPPGRVAGPIWRDGAGSATQRSNWSRRNRRSNSKGGRVETMNPGRAPYLLFELTDVSPDHLASSAGSGMEKLLVLPGRFGPVVVQLAR